MSKSLKIVLVVLGSLVLVLALAVGGFVWWLRSNMGNLEATARTNRAEGEAFGRERTGAECLVEAVARVDRCDGMVCEVGTQHFLERCLEVAAVPPDFCRNVPQNGEILASVKYRLQVCLEHQSRDQQVCSRLLDAVQTYCHPRSE